MEDVRNIIPKMLGSLRINKKFNHVAVKYYWKSIVGNDIANQAQPIDVEYGVLQLSAPNSVWAHHLAMMKYDIIKKINAFFSEEVIKDIRFRNNTSKNNYEAGFDYHTVEDDVSMKSVLKRFELSVDDVKTVETIGNEIEDQKLKNKLRKIYTENIKLNKYRLSLGWHKCKFCQTLCQSDELYCRSCSIQIKKDRLRQIRQILQEVPWATYAEVKHYVECSNTEYIDAKITLMQNIAEKVQDDDADNMTCKILTMLFTGARLDKINDNMVQKTLGRFRRKKYVSTSRR